MARIVSGLVADKLHSDETVEVFAHPGVAVGELTCPLA